MAAKWDRNCWKVADLPPTTTTIADVWLHFRLTDNTIFGIPEKRYVMRKRFSRLLWQSRGDVKIPRFANWSRPKVVKNATIPNNKLVIAMECLRMMEAKLTFALPNQFLVWVAKRFLRNRTLTYYLLNIIKRDWNPDWKIGRHLRMSSSGQNQPTWLDYEYRLIGLRVQSPHLRGHLRFHLHLHFLLSFCPPTLYLYLPPHTLLLLLFLNLVLISLFCAVPVPSHTPHLLIMSLF